MGNTVSYRCLKGTAFIKGVALVSALLLVACGDDTKTTAPTSEPIAKKIAPVAGPKTSDPKPVVKTVRAAVPVDGEKLYKRCAACHLPTGEGVPGAFPPLKEDVASLLNSEMGKEYLVLVANYGVAGTLSVSDQTYSGVMPAQGGLNAEKTAAILNYVMQDLNGISPDDARLFTPEFVEETKAKQGRLSGRKVMELREQAYASVH